jgi:hypothetical protein
MVKQQMADKTLCLTNLNLQIITISNKNNKKPMHQAILFGLCIKRFFLGKKITELFSR